MAILHTNHLKIRVYPCLIRLIRVLKIPKIPKNPMKKILSFALCALSFAACKHRHHDQNASENTENTAENTQKPTTKPAANVAVTPAAGNLDFAFFLESSGSMFA